MSATARVAAKNTSKAPARSLRLVTATAGVIVMNIQKAPARSRSLTDISSLASLASDRGRSDDHGSKTRERAAPSSTQTGGLVRRTHPGGWSAERVPGGCRGTQRYSSSFSALRAR
ncbi:hypothetical protein [Halorussus caseinilyticus]|uniref:Uncharacterized protein n=1 Tax=Halorussus caseinilyticus TaxID=3034025 RepID=A0ABD5WJN1_9EURY